MDKYFNHIGAINKHINGFSKFLNDRNVLNLEETISLPQYLRLLEINLDEHKWPNGSSKGVYFLFGKKETDEKTLGLYIGKASVAIGHRLFGHLNPWKDSRNYQMKDSPGNIFRLELATSIPLPEEIDFFAPSLEEYLISKMKRDFYLLNSVGNG